MSGWRIVAYTFRADTYCPACVIEMLPTGPGQRYDGWALAAGVAMSTEDNLAELAVAFGVDRENEHSFDSGEFPKRVYADSLDGDFPEYCGHCDRDLSTIRNSRGQEAMR